jgi:putative thioredoxin
MRSTNDSDFNNDVLNASKERPVLVDFWAPWCGPCRMLGPVLEKLAAEYAGQVDFVKINTDENPGISQAFQIRSIPAVKLFRDGEVRDEFVGAQPATAIREFLRPHLAPLADDPLVKAVELLDAGDALAATQILDRLPADRQASDAARQLYNRAHFVALAQTDPGDSADMAIRVAAAQLALAGRFGEAIQELLNRVRGGGSFARGEGRTDLLRLFELAGHDRPEVGQARRSLAALLN